MTPNQPIPLALALAGALSACSGGEPSPTATGSGVVVTQVSLPVASAVYRGANSHRFLDETVTLFCGTHGVFSGSVEPPTAVGRSVLSTYVATFVGELVLQPPVTSSPETHALTVQAQMAERITLSETRGSSQIFDTELVAFELRGSGMPEGIVIHAAPMQIRAIKKMTPEAAMANTAVRNSANISIISLPACLCTRLLTAGVNLRENP